MSAEQFETSLLRTFIAVVDTGGFSKASSLLSLTQPTVSLRIKRLEEQCGRPLFERNGQGAELTEEGNQLLRYARRIVNLQDEAWTAIKAQGISGSLRVGLIPDLSLQPITKALYAFARAHPELRLEVSEGTSDSMREAMRESRLDMALLVGEEGLNAPLYRHEKIGWICRRDFTWHKEEPLPLVLCPEPCRFREMAFTQLEAAGYEWRLALSSQSLSVTKEAVEAGLGVTVRGESLCNPKLINGEKMLGLPTLGAIKIVVESSAKATNQQSIDALTELLLVNKTLEVVQA